MTGGVVRLWLRSLLRRPLRGVVLVLALLLISTTTIAALVAADGLASMFDRDARAEWGPVDVEGHAAQDSSFDDLVGRYLVDRAGPGVLAGAPRLVLPAAVTAGSRTEQGLALGLGAEESGFPRLVASRGLSDPGLLKAGQVILNQRVARRLHAQVGDEILLVLAVPEWRERRAQLAEPLVHPATSVRLQLRVAGVVADAGTADLHRTPNALLDRSALQAVTGLVGRSTVLDLRLRTAGHEPLKQVLDAVDPVARKTGMVFRPVKQEQLVIAGSEGGLFRSILLTLAFLVVAAAVGGTVQLVVSLVRERNDEVAYLRAAGTPRWLLQRALVVEAVVHGAVAAALGALVSVPVSTVLAGALAHHLASLDAGRGRETVPLSTTVRPATVVTGAVLVLLVSAGAGRAAARRALTADPDVLLRADFVAVPPAPQGLRRPVLLLSCGALCVGAGISGVGALLYLGLTLVLAAWWVWRRRSDRGVDPRAAGLGLMWSVAGAAALGNFSQGVQAGFGVITVAGLVAVVCGCVLAVPHLRAIMRWGRSYTPRGAAQLALISAGARAERQAGASGVAASVVAGAYFGVVALAVLGSAAALPVSRQAGGFDVLGTSVGGIDSARLARAAPAARSVVAVPHATLHERDYWTDDGSGRRGRVPYPVRLMATEADLVAGQRWGLAAALPQYKTAAQALTAVIVDGDKAVVDRQSRPEGAEPGDDVVLDLGDGPRRFTLVAVLDTFLLDGVLIGDKAFRDTGLDHGNTFVLAAGGPQAQRQLQEAGRSEGLRMTSAARHAEDVVEANRAFTDVFAVVLALALGVSLISTAAGVVRSGRERRVELGLLKALGLPRRGVVLELAGEPVLVTLVGIAVGAAVGVAVLRTLFAVGYSDLPFVLPGWPLAGLAVGTVLLSGLVGVAAAWPAALVPPDVGLADLG